MSIPTISSYRMSDASTLPKSKLLDNQVSWTIDSDKSVLLIHDMQSYFVDFYHRDSEPMNQLLKNIKRLKSTCKKAGIPIIYTAQPGNQTSKDRALLTDFWGPGLDDKPELTDIVSDLAPELTDIQYTKWRYSAFKRTPLKEFLSTEGRDQIIVCGIYAHIGILSTALEAFMEDIQTTVVADAVADFSEQEHQMALTYIAQRCGNVDTCNSVIEQLSQIDNKMSKESMRQDICNILGLPKEEVLLDENLMYAGLDSIRLMTLVEQWREQGAEINFMDLAESATIDHWWQIIQNNRRTHSEASNKVSA